MMHKSEDIEEKTIKFGHIEVRKSYTAKIFASKVQTTHSGTTKQDSMSKKKKKWHVAGGMRDDLCN